MTIRYCDACGKQITQPEIGEHLVFNESPDLQYDLCDLCGAKMFAILAHKSWSSGGRAAGASPDGLTAPPSPRAANTAGADRSPMPRGNVADAVLSPIVEGYEAQEVKKHG